MQWVIKLGGSVTHYSQLTHWLTLIAQHGDGRVIIVPGGGIYADAVRTFQSMRAQLPDGHLSDMHAHRLAIFAMDQMARSFVAMVPELVLVRNPLEIAERGWQHRGLVWLPSEMALDTDAWIASGLAENWTVTSDTLAAYLANRLEADQLLLVKSDPRLLTPAADYALATLQSQSIVDMALHTCLFNARFNLHVMHHAHFATFSKGFHHAPTTGRVRYNND